MPVGSIRYRPEQERWLAELTLDFNRELEDVAREAGTFRPELRVSDADVVRVALDWAIQRDRAELREKVLAEARRVRPGRPPKVRR